MLNRHQEALQLKQQALAFLKKTLPSDHPRISIMMVNLAQSLSDLGQSVDSITVLLY
jgi:hypothetical protein